MLAFARPRPRFCARACPRCHLLVEVQVKVDLEVEIDVDVDVGLR